MAGYDIFAVCQPNEPPGPLYPALSADFTLQPEAGDGVEGRTYNFHGMYALDVKDGQVHVRNGAGDLRGTLWVTDQRVALVCKNYDKVHWDRGNNFGAVMVGLGTETAFHLASKAYHRIASVGKAMTAHFYYAWIDQVMWSPATDRKHPAAVRFGVQRNLTSGQQRLYLELRFDDGTDTSWLAQDVTKRIAHWYLNGPLQLSDEQRAKMTPYATVGPLRPPMPGSLVRYDLPLRHFVNETNTAGALTAKAKEAATKAALAERAAGVAREKALLFRSHSSESRPPAEWVEVDKDKPPYESPLGIVIGPKRTRLWPVAGETVLLDFSAQARGNFRADPSTKLPLPEGGAVRPLYQGLSRFLVTSQRLCVVLFKGTSAAGDVTTDDSVLVVVTPLAQISEIGLTLVTNVPGHTGPDLVLLDVDPSWGGTWVSSILSETHWGSEGPLSIDKKPLDLAETATRLALVVAQARGQEGPERYEIPGGFMYRLGSAETAVGTAAES